MSATTMAVMALVGGAVSAYGQYQQGQETKQAQDYNAAIEEQSATLIRAGAEREAGIIKQNAILNEYRQRKQLAMVTGQQVGGYAARGVAVGTGSPLDVIADSISNAELEIAIGKWSAQYEADITKYNAELAAKNKESSAELRRRYGKSAATQAGYQSVGTLLTSGTTAYSRLGKEIKPTTIDGSALPTGSVGRTPYLLK